jgi:cysteinyl-tRNA synthetase
MKIYNTLTRKIEELVPTDLSDVRIYMCGPTVYNFAHIGHMRTYVNNDLLVRTLEYNGLVPKTVMNLTDVGHLTSDADTGEDKMEKGAKKEGKSVWEIAKFYTDDFFASCQALNIRRPNVVCKATDNIAEQILLVQELEKKGFTYLILGDGVYFDTAKLPDYGRLWPQERSKFEPGKRVKLEKGKRNPTDFALWKFEKPDEGRQMVWKSPWGQRTYPGWHIECSAMSMKYLSDCFGEGKFLTDKFKTIDIHLGGVEHIPIHHTNEIAQSEAATGKKFVQYWVHSEHLLVEKKKMSKSANNFFRVKDIMDKGFDPLSLRYMFLMTHYRKKLNFTWDGLKSAQLALDKLKALVGEARRLGKQRSVLSEEDFKKIRKFQQEFKEKINDDLNLPQALTVVWKVIKSNIPSYDKYDLVLDFDQILGLSLGEITGTKTLMTKEVLALVRKRDKLRAEGKWEEADKVRIQIKQKGYRLEDTKKGTIVRTKRIKD